MKDGYITVMAFRESLYRTPMYNREYTQMVQSGQIVFRKDCKRRITRIFSMLTLIQTNIEAIPPGTIRVVRTRCHHYDELNRLLGFHANIQFTKD